MPIFPSFYRFVSPICGSFFRLCRVCCECGLRVQAPALKALGVVVVGVCDTPPRGYRTSLFFVKALPQSPNQGTRDSNRRRHNKMPDTCPSCGSSEIETDPSRGSQASGGHGLRGPALHCFALALSWPCSMRGAGVVRVGAPLFASVLHAVGVRECGCASRDLCDVFTPICSRVKFQVRNEHTAFTEPCMPWPRNTEQCR